MYKVNGLISLMMFTGLTLSGCSVQEKKEDDKRSSTSAGQTETPVAKDKGRLGLKMPKQDKVRYSALEVTLEQAYGCREPHPMPEPLPAEGPIIGEEETGSSAALRTVVENNMDYEDTSYKCDSGSTQSYSQTFKYVEGGTVSIDDIVPGSYKIHVRLLGEAGEALEEGYGWAEVTPGVVTHTYVEIYPTSGNGRLDIQIVRGGDQIDCGDDRGDLCSPSAYMGEDGKVHYGECSTYSDDGSSEDDTPVGSDDAVTASAQ